ncbi:MAG: hypothetical protein U0531_04815 [Dehalococcoidia bacterium]
MPVPIPAPPSYILTVWVDDVLSLVAALVTYCFAAAVFDQYLDRPRGYRLIWTAALLAFAASFTAQFVAALHGWSPLLFRVWYGFGALNAVPLLGLGTVYLLCPRWAKIAATVIVVELLFWGFARIFGVALDPVALTTAPGATHPATQLVLPPDIRATAVLLNSLGSLALIVGAAWSAWSFRRRRSAPHRVQSNLLIAGGALLAGAAGSLEEVRPAERAVFSAICSVSRSSSPASCGATGSMPLTCPCCGTSGVRPAGRRARRRPVPGGSAAVAKPADEPFRQAGGGHRRLRAFDVVGHAKQRDRAFVRVVDAVGRTWVTVAGLAHAAGIDHQPTLAQVDHVAVGEGPDQRFVPLRRLLENRGMWVWPTTL